MVMPCCNNCYAKYINEDGSIDENAVEQLNNESKVFVEKYNKEHPERSKPLVFQPVSCNCICHKKGMNVFH